MISVITEKLTIKYEQTCDKCNYRKANNKVMSKLLISVITEKLTTK